jgi:transposase
MLEEPTPGGKAVTVSADDLTLGRPKTGRPHPQALRSDVIAAVMDGASYRQAAARRGVSISVAWKWSHRFRHTGSIAAKPMGGDGRARLKGARFASAVPDRPHGAAEISREADHRNGK